MVKRLLGCILLLAWLLPLAGEDDLAVLIANRRWVDLSARCRDDSWRFLEARWTGCTSLEVAVVSESRLAYQAKFPDHAEIGTLTFRREGDRFSGLAIENPLSPLHFIDSFRRFPVRDREFRLGDARVRFRRGDLYQALPAGKPLLFEGEWELLIEPSDAEERLTLERITHQPVFRQPSEVGVFVLQDQSLLRGLVGVDAGRELPQGRLHGALANYENYFGLRIDPFAGTWFLPPRESDNLIVLSDNRGGVYLFDYNEEVNPDTQLRGADNRLLLSYNAVGQPKLLLGGGDGLQDLQLSLYCNPVGKFLSGTAMLRFVQGRSFRQLRLNPGLLIRANGQANPLEVNLVRKGDTYFVFGPETDQLRFFYSGIVQTADRGSDRFDLRSRLIPPKPPSGTIFTLDRGDNFYPNPGSEFVSSRLTVSLPRGQGCLATGALAGKREVGDRTVFDFRSPGAKGMALACGQFEASRTLGSVVPIRIFHDPDLTYQRFVSLTQLRRCVDLFTELYGRLDVPELNILFHRGKRDGGVSNQGFIVFHIDDRNPPLMNASSPVGLTHDRTAYLVHELAHQWWGGVVSGLGSPDMWITEGMAQFSTLHFLQRTLSPTRFRGVASLVKRWVLRDAESGPVVYGRRIADLEGRLEPFQSVVYDKAALTLLMARDLIGEKELFARLRRLLEERRHHSLTSAEMVARLGADDPRLARFFRGWLYDRQIPRVRYRVRFDGTRVELRLRVDKAGTVFPLPVTVISRSGKDLHLLIVDQPEQIFAFEANTEISALDINDTLLPIRLSRDELPAEIRIPRRSASSRPGPAPGP